MQVEESGRVAVAMCGYQSQPRHERRRRSMGRFAVVLGVVLLGLAGMTDPAGASSPCSTPDESCTVVGTHAAEAMEERLLAVSHFITDVVLPVVIGGLAMGTMFLSRKWVGAFRKRQQYIDRRWRELEEATSRHASPDVVLLTSTGQLGGRSYG